MCGDKTPWPLGVVEFHDASIPVLMILTMVILDKCGEWGKNGISWLAIRIKRSRKTFHNVCSGKFKESEVVLPVLTVLDFFSDILPENTILPPNIFYRIPIILSMGKWYFTYFLLIFDAIDIKTLILLGSTNKNPLKFTHFCSFYTSIDSLTPSVR